MTRRRALSSETVLFAASASPQKSGAPIFFSRSRARSSQCSTSKIAPELRQDLASVLEPLSCGQQVHRFPSSRRSILRRRRAGTKPRDLPPDPVGFDPQLVEPPVVFDAPMPSRVTHG